LSSAYGENRENINSLVEALASTPNRCHSLHMVDTPKVTIDAVPSQEDSERVKTAEERARAERTREFEARMAKLIAECSEPFEVQSPEFLAERRREFNERVAAHNAKRIAPYEARLVELRSSGASRSARRTLTSTAPYRSWPRANTVEVPMKALPEEPIQLGTDARMRINDGIAELSKSQPVAPSGIGNRIWALLKGE
jgi:hypothetical protein